MLQRTQGKVGTLDPNAPLILMRFLRTNLLNITERDLDCLEIYIQQHFSFPREIGQCLIFQLQKLGCLQAKSNFLSV